MRTFGTIFLLLALPFLAFAQTNIPAGKIVWWGDNRFNQYEYLSHTNGLVEIGDEFVTNAVAAAGGFFDSIALKNNGTIFNPFAKGFTATAVPTNLNDVVSITAVGNAFFAIGRDGTLTRFGISDRAEDMQRIIPALSNVVSICGAGLGGDDSGYLAVRKDGVVIAFHHADLKMRFGRVRIQNEILSNVMAVASMGITPLVLKNDGSVYQLGYQTPGKPPAKEIVKKVADDAITIDYGGESKYLPFRYTAIEPIIVDGQPLSDVVSIASDNGHALALERDGTVVAIGNDYDGMGDIPSGISNVIAISVCGNDNMVLKRDGTVSMWGNNSFHQASVPAGLSNVVAIAAGGNFSLAITTGNIPSSVFIELHGRLEELAQESDLVFKGKVISTRPITNSAFIVSSMNVNATTFKIISVLKGSPPTDEIIFEHYSDLSKSFMWSGTPPPARLKFDVGKSYIVFAAKMDRRDKYYSPPAKKNSPANEFRQIVNFPKTLDEGMLRTLDARKIENLSIKEAYWLELNLLLNDSNPGNQLYAIDKLDEMCLKGDQYEEWHRSDDFKRQRVLTVLLPLTTNNHEQVAIRAIKCFNTSSNAVIQLKPFAGVLMKIANDGSSPLRRLTAIDALSGIDCDSISNSLAQLLKSTNENIEIDAIGLLPRFQKKFAESELRKHSTGNSPKIRAAVADAIGNGKMTALLPVLEKLWNDTNNVHTDAGNAL